MIIRGGRTSTRRENSAHPVRVNNFGLTSNRQCRVASTDFEVSLHQYFRRLQCTPTTPTTISVRGLSWLACNAEDRFRKQRTTVIDDPESVRLSPNQSISAVRLTHLWSAGSTPSTEGNLMDDIYREASASVGASTSHSPMEAVRAAISRAIAAAREVLPHGQHITETAENVGKALSTAYLSAVPHLEFVSEEDFRSELAECMAQCAIYQRSIELLALNRAVSAGLTSENQRPSHGEDALPLNESRGVLLHSESSCNLEDIVVAAFEAAAAIYVRLPTEFTQLNMFCQEARDFFAWPAENAASRLLDPVLPRDLSFRTAEAFAAAAWEWCAEGTGRAPTASLTRSN